MLFEDMTHNVALELQLMRLREVGFVDVWGKGAVHMTRGELGLTISSYGSIGLQGAYKMATIPAMSYLAMNPRPSIFTTIPKLIAEVKYYADRIIAGDGEAWLEKNKPARTSVNVDSDPREMSNLSDPQRLDRLPVECCQKPGG
jgi:hypothetical protein